MQVVLQLYRYHGQLSANGIQGATVPACTYLNVFLLPPPIFPLLPLLVLAPSLSLHPSLLSSSFLLSPTLSSIFPLLSSSPFPHPAQDDLNTARGIVNMAGPSSSSSILPLSLFPHLSPLLPLTHCLHVVFNFFFFHTPLVTKLCPFHPERMLQSCPLFSTFLT